LYLSLGANRDCLSVAILSVAILSLDNDSVAILSLEGKKSNKNSPKAASNSTVKRMAEYFLHFPFLFYFVTNFIFCRKQLKRKQDLERRRAMGEVLSEDEDGETEERKDKPKMLKKIGFVPPKSIVLQRSPAWKVEQDEWKKVRNSFYILSH